MKRKFSRFAALVAGLLILATGCKNASQIVVTDTEKNRFTDDGFAELSMKLEPKFSRTIFPQDWEEEKKKTLLYFVTGKPTNGGSAAKATEMNSGVPLEYEDLKAGTAKIQLDPIEWDLTLTAYQTSKDPNNAVLIGEKKNVNMATGSDAITFSLKVQNGSSAAGEINFDIHYLAKAEDKLNTVAISVVDPSGNVIKTTDGAEVKVDPADITSAHTANGGKGTIIINKQKVPAGEHILKVVFTNTDNKVVLQYEEPIVVDGGNLTTAIINIPEDSFNRVPEKPTEFKADLLFKPDSNPLRIQSIKEDYGQEVDGNTNGSDATPQGVYGSYEATFTWKDNSFNESGFKLFLAEKEAPGTIYTVIKKASNSKEVEILDNTNSAVVDGSITYVKGNLAPGSESITLKFNTGKFYKADIVAVNSLVDTTNEVGLKTSATPNGEDYIGMFTVAYKLREERGGDGYIKYESSGKTSKDYFVKAYAYDKTGNTLPISGTYKEYPFVKSDNYVFSQWESKSTDVQPKYTPVQKLANKNQTVYAAWLREAQIKVEYPTYSAYMNLPLISEQVKTELVIPTSGSGDLSISVPSDTKYANAAFKVFYDSASANPKTDLAAGATTSANENGIEINGKVLTWHTKTYTETKGNGGGIFRIEVSYTYTPGASETAKEIKGCIYAKLSN